MISPNAILGASILIVDDLEANVLLLRRTLASAGYTHISSTTNPREVKALHWEHRYDVILLDLAMPGMDGFEVMEALRENDPDDYLPVLVITAQPGQKLRALQAGAKDFLSKPFDLAEVLARVSNLLQVRLLHRELHRQNEVLEERVQARTNELREGYVQTVYTLTRAAELKDEDTGVHVQRISFYCAELSKWLGKDAVFIDQIFFASPMHDVGKIGIPDSILLKPGRLTPEEWEIMKGHAAMGARILGQSRSPYLRLGAEIALNHHERWDGGGYPNGKRGEEIPMMSRIMNLCDIYDALRSKRPYKPALDHDQTVSILLNGDGRTQPEHFDPVIIAAFMVNHRSFQEIFDAYEDKAFAHPIGL